METPAIIAGLSDGVSTTASYRRLLQAARREPEQEPSATEAPHKNRALADTAHGVTEPAEGMSTRIVKHERVCLLQLK